MRVNDDDDERAYGHVTQSSYRLTRTIDIKTTLIASRQYAQKVVRR